MAAMDQYTGLLGVAVLLLIAFALSSHRRAIRPRIVIVGLLLQFVLAFVLMRVGPVVEAYNWLARLLTKVLTFSEEGSRFLFGSLADESGQWGFVFAFKVLPVIVFFASLMAVLYHLGVMQRIVQGLAWVLKRSLGVTGEEALAAAANVFIGQTEAPLCIKPFVPRLTRSQLMLVMTGGFATIAGSVLSAYVFILGGDVEADRVEYAKHLLTASAMSAPGAFLMAKIFLPETEDTPAIEELADTSSQISNLLDAAAAGAGDGLKLALNVAAMLVAFVALLALVNWPIEALGETAFGDWIESVLGLEALGLQALLGLAFRPVAYMMGLTGADAAAVGSILGTSMFATEFVAYFQLGDLIRVTEAGTGGGISPRAAAITTFALCGFANFPSIAIQIGGLSAIAPSRRSEIAALGPRAMLAGAMSCWMTGCIASVFIPITSAG